MITEHVLAGVLAKNGLKLKNTARGRRVADSKYAGALLTLALLCHPGCGIFPNREGIREFVRLFFDTDPVRSSLLAGRIYSHRPFPGFPELNICELLEIEDASLNDKYNFIREWCHRYNGQTLPLDQFFSRAFLEVLAHDGMGADAAADAVSLIEAASAFINAVSKFNRNAAKDFLELSTAGERLIGRKPGDQTDSSRDYILLTTPAEYLASPVYSRITVLLSISSDNWSTGCAREVSNPLVLKSSWPAGMEYTQEMEDNNRRHDLAATMRLILKRCSGKIITFESLLSANGFENEGLLSEYLDTLPR
jgi:hypothetical protein